MNLQQTIVNLFDTHPTVDVFYMTSDQQFFEQQNNADYHASKLPKRGVATLNRGMSDQLKEALTANTSLTHPEQTTALTPEQIAAKQAEDNTAQDNLTKAIGSVLNKVVSDSKMVLVNDETVIKHIVTQEDLDANPELVEDGVNVGDEIDVPGAETVDNATVKSPLEIALETPEADRTPVQKGLITKAANAAIKAPIAGAQEENTNTDTDTQA